MYGQLLGLNIEISLLQDNSMLPTEMQILAWKHQSNTFK